ncbi:MAG: 30S ribosomal protein S20 [Chlorobiota bacterium]|jgi:small subunit ribosomal protein S20|nr:30S ribosomal protein S20 [Chlorobiota bacterium]QQS67625.1 MAG: 30S ribosomal protein S20 [Chlorobiota bacterium]
MPNHVSSEKRVRQTKTRRTRNRFQRVALRNAIKAFTVAESKEDLLVAEQKATQLLDRYANKGLIHKNLAARKKSQMAHRISAI